MTTVQPEEHELVDPTNRLVLRRVVVGALDTNCWILHRPGSRRAVIVDPGDDPRRIIDACHDLSPTAVVLTHEHWDHVLAVPDLVDAYGIDVLAHPDERAVWTHEKRHLAAHGHFDAGTGTVDLLDSGCDLGAPPGRPLWHGRTTPIHHGSIIGTGALRLRVIHTPGHTPGGVSLLTKGHVFTGDTLFPGGPGLTGWPLSDFDTIIDSIRRRLLTLPIRTAVHPGHGRSTTIGAEAPALPDWIERGW